MQDNLKTNKILFFDGYCTLCNGFIDFIFRYDQKQNLLVASLQGKTAKSLLPPKKISGSTTASYALAMRPSSNCSKDQLFQLKKDCKNVVIHDRNKS